MPTPDAHARTEIRDSMRITWHQPITMDDGLTLRADVYRPVDETAQCPVFLYQCIEWTGTQPWSNGKVGLLGISYYASNQWRVAAMDPPPPHLAAIIPWEGQNDRYRD